MKILFIGGAGRSGSTLLERILGTCDHFICVGELRFILDRGLYENQLCGCGNPFHECVFWRSVIEKVLEGLKEGDIRRLMNLRKKIVRTRYIPFLLLKRLRPKSFERRLQEYAYFIEKLYTAIQKISGGRVIVDSSKDPAYGFLLNSIFKENLYVIHLVRDSRATAYSWQRRKKRPEIYWKESYMPKRNIFVTSLEWNVRNALMELLSKVNKKSLFAPYEDVCTNPEQIIQKVLHFIGEEEFAQISLKNRRIILKTNHTVAGNPLRFVTGEVQINLDNEWCKRMNKAKYFVVTGLTSPFLIRYGYTHKKAKEIK